MMRTTSMKIIGQDANGKNLCVCHFECDSAADLPAYNVYQSDGYVFAMSSTAHTIDADKKYELDSAGNWIEQSQPWQPLADYSVLTNKPQINGNVLIGNQSGADLGLQNTLTFDSTPTQGSTNPVTSGGIWTDQQRQEAEIGVIANAGAKNLLWFDLESVKSLNGGRWNGNETTINGVTVTVNDVDKTISFVRTASGGDIYFRLSDNLRSILSSGTKYILNGATGGSSTTFYLGNYANWENMNGDTEITYTGTFVQLYVCVKSTMPLNTTITINPMIRPAAITDPTFQPYAPTNRELYEMILALQNGAS